MPAAFDRVSVLVPKATPPAPDRLTIEAPLVVAEISNAPVAATEELAILPPPDSARVPPVIVVMPKNVLTPVRVSVPVVRARPPVPLSTPPKVCPAPALERVRVKPAVAIVSVVPVT